MIISEPREGGDKKHLASRFPSSNQCRVGRVDLHWRQCQDEDAVQTWMREREGSMWSQEASMGLVSGSIELESPPSNERFHRCLHVCQ